jgi:colanic acid biosynthesis glycosyl transferase WcaI
VKILVYGINFAPELTGIGKYTGDMAAWLASRGHEVRVVTAPPYYPNWKVGSGYINAWSKSFEFLDNPRGSALRNVNAGTGAGSLTVFRCPLWVPAKPDGAKRLLHLASFALSSFPVLLQHLTWRPDVVWVVEPPLFCSPAALLIARLSGARSWLHIQDYEVDAAFDLGLLKGQRLRRLVQGGERWLMRRFDVVSTISRRMLARAENKGVAPAALRFLPNWVDLAPFSSSLSIGAAAYRRELSIPQDAIVALYSGNMGGKQGLKLLADAARLCVDDDGIVFVFCGNGTGRGDLMARCEGLPNVRWLDLQPVQRLPDLLAMANIHLLPQRADAADLVMPSKLTGMLASGRSVVATAEPGTEVAEVVSCCGLVVPPGDAKQLANGVVMLSQDKALRESLGEKARAFAETYYDREAILLKYEAELRSLTAQP